MDKKVSVQETLHERLHVIFKNDRKKIFPFLKIAMGKTSRTSKEVLKLSSEEAAKVLSFLNFFISELDRSYELGEVKGEMHRNFLWGSNKDELRVLLLMRRGMSSGEISKKLEMSLDWIYEIQYGMLARGAALGKFTRCEEMFSKRVKEDLSIREKLESAYDEDFMRCAARFSFRVHHLERRTCFGMVGYYMREQMAKTLFGGNFSKEELAI